MTPSYLINLILMFPKCVLSWVVPKRILIHLQLNIKTKEINYVFSWLAFEKMYQ